MHFWLLLTAILTWWEEACKNKNNPTVLQYPYMSDT